jgi:hypothetical protein
MVSEKRVCPNHDDLVMPAKAIPRLHSGGRGLLRPSGTSDVKRRGSRRCPSPEPLRFPPLRLTRRPSPRLPDLAVATNARRLGPLPRRQAQTQPRAPQILGRVAGTLTSWLQTSVPAFALRCGYRSCRLPRLPSVGGEPIKDERPSENRVSKTAVATSVGGAVVATAVLVGIAGRRRPEAKRHALVATSIVGAIIAATLIVGRAWR